MKMYSIICENDNCKTLFKSPRKKRFCGRKKCNNDRANSYLKNKYKISASFRKLTSDNSKRYRKSKILKSNPDGLRHEICCNCGGDYSYPIRSGMPRKYCDRIECRRDRDRKEYHVYVSNPDNRKKFNEICKKAHKKYHNENKELENKKCRDYRIKNLKKERYRDKKRHKKDNREFLYKNGLPKDYIHEFKYEKIMKAFLDKIFPGELHVDNKRFVLSGNKLRQTNPFKKKNIELDRFYPKLRIAFEFDGDQHKRFISYFHKTKDGFRNQIKKDKCKDEVCLLVGIKLIRVTFEELDINIIKSKL